MADSLTGNPAGLRTNGGSMLLPFFNDDFINGSNIFSTKVGKIYENVEFPFHVDVRTTTGEATLPFYVFAADYSKLHADSQLNNHGDSGYGDLAILSRDGDDYFISASYGSSDTKASDNGQFNNIDASNNKRGVLGFFPFNENNDNDDEE